VTDDTGDTDSTGLTGGTGIGDLKFGSTPEPPKTKKTDPWGRPRWPWFLLAGFVVVVLAVAAVGIVVHQRNAAAARNKAHALAAGQAYLADWSKANDAGVRSVSSGPNVDAVVAAMDQQRKGLEVTKAVITPGLMTLKGSSGAIPYSAVLTMQGLGTYAYDGTVPLARASGQWTAAPTLAAVHPQLVEGRSFARNRIAATRGNLLANDGTVLRGQDGELDSNLLGTVGAITTKAQAVAAGPKYQVGDTAGLSGLERAYNTQLGGTPGGQAVLVESTTHSTVVVLEKFAAKAGGNLTTTLDLNTQRTAESALGVLTKPAAMVAIDTRTGGMLAEVNNPLGGYSRSLRGTYPPGSTFKVITATAGLLAGKTPDSVLQCPPTVSVDGRSFGNAENEQFGPISFATAFAKSCNTAFINLQQSIPQSDMTKAAQLFGMDGSEPLPIKSFGGSYPTPTDAVDGASAAIGQGRVVVSPLQMASVASAVASGVWRKPFVVGQSSTVHALPANVTSALQGFMEGVVQNGTAAGVGLPAGTHGKTGTAEFGTAPAGQQPPTHAWFIGYRGNVAFAIVVEGGGFGGAVAAPVAASFLNSLAG
jgi:hypothetical protein